MLEANLLVVKDKVYASMGKLCVESFLYFHPRSTVVIHVDRFTTDAVSKKLRKLVSSERVEIRLIENQDQPWQNLKLNMILSLGAVQKFFMDADLKWNGPMAPLNGITFFVNEFNFTSNDFYAPLVKCNWFQEYKNSSMKNTSFFYWGGYVPTAYDIKGIRELMTRISQLTLDKNNSPQFNLSTSRISEQIALSLVVEKINCPINFLKLTDGYKDGSFLESSYFGATGNSF
jgi:hypothetical protein